MLRKMFLALRAAFILTPLAACSVEETGDQNVATAETGAEPEGVAPPAPTSKRGSETVLVVEDEASLLHLVAEIMQDSGYNVLAAHGPKEALRLLHEHREEIHLLLTDVVMPGMSGRALAGRRNE